MPGNTARGFPYVVPTDHPLEYPAASQQLADAIEARGILAANAIKSADQTGIASAGSAGITATLGGLRVGSKVLGIFNLLANVPAGASGTLFLTTVGLTGATVVGSSYQHKISYVAATAYQLTGFYLFSATAASMSVGMAGTNSQSQVWTCYLGSSITLVSL